MTVLWNFWKRPSKAERHHDPLDHPELRRMSLAELADLPMPVYAKKSGDACL